MNTPIMMTFIAVRKIIFHQMDLKLHLNEIRERLGEHDSQLNQIYDALETIPDEKAAEIKWDEREKTGLK